MSYSVDFSISWEYPSTGAAPPTPVIVHTVPEYFGGQPTPPPSPPRAHATRPADPCPPTPYCVPSSVVEDELEGSNSYRSTSELDHSTHFVDTPANLASNDPDNQDEYNATPHVSDGLLYAREQYAYPSPILTMIKRAKLDLEGLQAQLVNPWACGQPFKLFSLTAGNTSVTGLKKHDEQSFDYYNTHCSAPCLGEPKSFYAFCFSIGTIQALEHELRMQWRWVYPEPIPPVVIRLHDLIGPYHFSQRGDGYAFVMPTEDSIWSTICQRGIDSNFRPISPSATVETGICHMGVALHYPQHIVASRFAVNVFLELPDSAGPSTPLCQYLGAYVLQVMDGLTISRSIWADIDPEVQKSIFNLVPHYFEGSQHPFLGWPRLPYVQFCYYKWDRCMFGLANTFRNRDILAAGRGVEYGNVYSDDDSHLSVSLDFDHCDVEPDTTSTPSAYSPKSGYMSFLDLSSCE